MCETKRLAIAKKKNEAALTEAELQGKYKQAYEKLCENLKRDQCELRTRYMDAVRELSEVMSDSVYLDPEEGPQKLHDEMLRRAAGSQNGALVKTLFYAFWTFYMEPQAKRRNTSEKA